MAVALGTGTPTRSLAPATYAGTPVTSASWTISGSDPLILVSIGMASNTAEVTSVTWSLGSGTPVEVAKWARTVGIASDIYQSVWAIPAPVTGGGTYTVTLTENVSFQISASYFTGAHQTTPCPITDDDYESSNTVPDGAAFTLTPTNVGANDAMFVGYSHRSSGDTNGWTTGTLLYESNSTATNMLTGYQLGVGSMTSAAMSSGSGTHAAAAAVRIQVSGGAPPATDPPVAVPILGYGAMGC